MMAAVAAAMAAVGVAGLIRGAVPQSTAEGSPKPAATTTGTIAGGPRGSETPTPAQSITVTGAYIRQPESPDGPAAAYMTVNNSSGSDDTLISVESGDADRVAIYDDASRKLVLTGLKIPAHTSVHLTPGRVHLIISRPYGPLRPGRAQTLLFWFDRAAPVTVPVPVIAITAPIPTPTVTR